jgi:tRNA G18 (ribose-2'-O)-methylase SpoU
MLRKKNLPELNRLTIEEFKATPKIPLVVVLDNIRSQHNVGAVFRTSDAFLVEKIYLCGITATPPNREIHKAALGATESVNWEYFEKTIDAINHLKNQNFSIFALEQTQNSISLLDFSTDGSFRLRSTTETRRLSGSETRRLSGVEASVQKTAGADLQSVPKFAIILGNEVDGISEDVLPLIDGALEIPQFGTKHSLNVSVSAGIAIWELFKIMNK